MANYESTGTDDVLFLMAQRIADGKEIESEGLISYMTKSGNIAQNMAPSVEDFESYFAKLLTKANNIIHISISGKVTDSAYSAAAEASKAFDNVTVIDSKHLSSGQALMVLEACQMVKEGLSVDEIRKRLESSWKNFSTSFVVRDLEYMEKACQVDGGILSITRALMVRPVLTMKKERLPWASCSSVHRKIPGENTSLQN